MDKKNIILITADEFRYDSMGCAGNEIVETPSLDKLAGEAMRFENANSASPLCVPSRVSMFTGQYVCTNNSIFFRPEDHVNLDRGSYFIETLKEKGYKIGIAGKNHAFTDDYFEKWFDYREDYGHWGKVYGEIRESDQKVKEWRQNDKREYFTEKAGGQCILQEGLIEEAEPFAEEECMTYRIAEDANKFIEENKGNPFFLYYSFPDPHWPTVVCEPYYSMYNPDKIELEALELDWDTHPFAHYVQSQVNGFENYTIEEKKKIVAVYYGMITYIDKAVGMVMDKLKELSIDEETIIIFTADHGNFAGRYGLVGKTKAFYDCLIKIPFIIKIPGMGQNEVRKAQISNIDILPTIFDYLGLDIASDIQGRSFLNVVKGEEDHHRDEVFAEVGRPINPPPIKDVDDYKEFSREQAREKGPRWFLDYTCNGRSAMIKNESWKYCYYVGDREELYHLEKDPLEIENLALRDEYSDVKLELKNKLFDWMLTQPYKPYLEEEADI